MNLSRAEFLMFCFLTASLFLAELAWSASCDTTIPTPAPASALGYNNLVFADQFNSTSTIDMAGSGAAGYKWYRKFDFPNVANTATDASYISVESGVLTLSSTTWCCGFTLMSAAYTSSPPYYVGYAIDPGQGFYFEIKAAFDPAYSPATCNWSNGTCGWPAFWSVAIEFLTGQSTANYEEPDFFEAFPSGAGTISQLMTMHEWNGPSGSSTQIANTNNSVSLGATFTQMHTYGFRLTPMAANGGTGRMERFFDGSRVSGADVTYTSSGPTSPGATPSNPNGAFSHIEEQRFPIILGTGFNWPLRVDYVGVWTPGPCDALQIDVNGLPIGGGSSVELGTQ